MAALSIREAAAKYSLTPSTVSRWVADGMIRVVERPDRRGLPMLINESDVAEVAKKAVAGPGRGRRARLKESLAAV